MLSLGPLDGSGDVVLFAFALVMFSAAGAGASKIEAQGREVGILEAARRPKHDLVVQRAAAEGVGMADDSDADRVLQLAIKRFQPSGTAVEIDVAQRLGIQIHLSLTRTRSPSPSGPPRCGQVFSVAKKPLGMWYSAMRRSPMVQTFARPVGRSDVFATSTNSIS